MAIARPLSQAQTLRVPVDGTTLNADLAIPVEAHGMVIFAHGSGSSRHSPRNQFVARVLQQSDFGTLLMDLLTEKEEARRQLQSRELRFDIRLLAKRLTATVDWLAVAAVVQASADRHLRREHRCRGGAGHRGRAARIS